MSSDSGNFSASSRVGARVMNTSNIRARLEAMERAAKTLRPEQRSHGFAMLAKEAVFKAQDELHRIADPGLRIAFDRLLSKVRGDLEELDSVMFDYQLDHE